MSFVPGSINLQPQDLNPWLKELARTLAELHHIEPTGLEWHFHRYTEPSELAVPSWTQYPDLWEKGIKIVKEKPPVYNEVFIHRDYHPVNVLWQDEKIVSVVDWVNGCRGPAAIDVGHCRNNLVCLFGVEVADGFLKFYENAAGSAFSYDPYWDLVSYFDFVYPGPPEVYTGWLDFGITHLNNALMVERLDEYLASLIQ